MPISRDNSGALHHGLAREYDGFTVPSCKKVRHSAHEIIDALEKPAWAQAFRGCDVVQCFLSLAKIAEGRCYVSMRESKVRVEGKCLLILLNSLFAPPALLIHVAKCQVHPWIIGIQKESLLRRFPRDLQSACSRRPPVQDFQRIDIRYQSMRLCISRINCNCLL